MHLTGEELAVINIAVGAGLAWGASALTQSRARQDARLARRRDAYATFILALDHLERTWNAPETLEAEYGPQTIGQVTAHAVREIQRGYVVVLLVGSEKAKKAASTVRKSAWALSEYLNSRQPGDPLKSNLGQLYEAFENDSRSFVKVAEDESGR